MRTFRFTVPLIALLGLSLWLIIRIVTRSSPDVTANVAVVLALLFLAAGSVVALVSWLLVRALRGELNETMALRHGLWAGLFVVLLPLLRWGSLLNPLMVAALLLVIVSVEAMLMLRTTPVRVKGRRPARKAK